VSAVIRVSLILTIAVLAAPLSSAGATSAATFSIRPTDGGAGYFVLEVARGKPLEGTARIVNTGGRPGTVFLYPVDAATGATSGAVYLDRSRPRQSVGAWLRLPVSRLWLRPGESRLLRFTARVPPNARAGDHLGGIVAENPQLTGAAGRAAAPRGQLRVRIRRLSIVAVHVVTPGPRHPAIRFGGVTAGGEGGYQMLFFSLRNIGNVLLKPMLDFTVTDCQGGRLQTGRQTLDTFVPKTAIRYPVVVRERPLAAGAYCVAGALRYAGRVSQFASRFTVTHEQVARVFTTPNPLAAEAEHPLTLAELVRDLKRITAAIGKRSVFPSLLVLVFVLFLVIQDRIDRRDPKLALAPVRPIPDLMFAPPPTERER
jgi:hypothetical protein